MHYISLGNGNYATDDAGNRIVFSSQTDSREWAKTNRIRAFIVEWIRD